MHAHTSPKTNVQNKLVTLSGKHLLYIQAIAVVNSDAVERPELPQGTLLGGRDGFLLVFEPLLGKRSLLGTLTSFEHTLYDIVWLMQ
jgi:hypothetical protein